MKNIIKKGLILLLLNLVVPIQAMCQTTFDSTEVKEIAIIFTEHEKLSIENPLLKEQIKSLETLNDLWLESDSIQRVEIQTFKEKSISDEKKIQKLKSTQKKTVLGTSVGGILLFILGIIL